MKSLYIPILFLSLVTLFSACKKDKEEDLGEYYFKGNVDGRSETWNATRKLDWWVGTSASTSWRQGIVTGSLTAWINRRETEKPQFSVIFKTFTTGAENKSLYFQSFMLEGCWDYSTTQENMPGHKGVIVEYTDSEGREYSSLGSQNGSSFKIVNVKKNSVASDRGSSEDMDLKMQLSCKLYPVSGSGAVISLTNVEALLNLQNLL